MSESKIVFVFFLKALFWKVQQVIKTCQHLMLPISSWNPAKSHICHAYHSKTEWRQYLLSWWRCTLSTQRQFQLPHGFSWLWISTNIPISFDWYGCCIQTSWDCLATYRKKGAGVGRRTPRAAKNAFSVWFPNRLRGKRAVIKTHRNWWCENGKDWGLWRPVEAESQTHALLIFLRGYW